VKPPTPFDARSLTLDDAHAAAAVAGAVEQAYAEEPETIDPAEVRDWWSRSNLRRDTLGIFGEDAGMVAYGTVRAQGDEDVFLDAFVHPDHTGRGLGSFLLQWAEQEASARGRPLLRTSALVADTRARPLLEERGFTRVRLFYRMVVDLDAPPPEPTWPAGLSVSTFRAGDERVLHDALEEAFADHWGHHARGLDEWQRMVFGREWWDPSLVYLVRDGHEVVAAEMSALRFGMGWIESLGTRSEWRGRGLGRALLLAAFGELYRRGQRRIGLAVDAGNETGATQLYRSVGMRVSWQADVWERRV
jgi:mycothiol synthase